MLKRNKEYLFENRAWLSKIPFLPNKRLRAGNKSFSLGSLHDYLKVMLSQNPQVFSLFDLSRNSPENWKRLYEKLDQIDTGGFDHGGNVAGKYAQLQSDPTYFLSRKTGYLGLIKLLNLETNSKTKPVVVDLLAGNGTFQRVYNTLLPKNGAQVIGLDVSKAMVFDGIQKGETLINTFYADSLLASNVADAVVAAYGTHHIVEQDRDIFVQSAKRLLKPKRRFVLQDFEEGGPTARWYSEVIHDFRPCGHSYKHFTEGDLNQYIRKHYKSAYIDRIYDPFYIEFNSNTHDETTAINHFYAYLIVLFSLEKLLPKGIDYESLWAYKQKDFWKGVDLKLKPYFSFKERQLAKITVKEGEVPVLDTILAKTTPGKITITAPRIALVGIGEA